MSALIPEMDFSTFQDFVQVSNPEYKVWTVTVLLKDLRKATFTIENCPTAFRAKEETFLYLKSRVLK